MKNFTIETKKILLQHKIVDKITNKRIIFTEEFKTTALKKYKKQRPIDIFRDEKFPFELFYPSFPSDVIRQFKKDRNQNTQKKIKKESSFSLEDTAHKVAYLQEEIEFLKKIYALKNKK